MDSYHGEPEVKESTSKETAVQSSALAKGFQTLISTTASHVAAKEQNETKLKANSTKEVEKFDWKTFSKQADFKRPPETGQSYRKVVAREPEPAYKQKVSFKDFDDESTNEDSLDLT